MTTQLVYDAVCYTMVTKPSKRYLRSTCQNKKGRKYLEWCVETFNVIPPLLVILLILLFILIFLLHLHLPPAPLPSLGEEEELGAGAGLREGEGGGRGATAG